MIRLVIGTIRLGFGVLRLVGYRRLVLFGAGVVVGLLVAPMTGRELRARLTELLEEQRGVGGDLAERIRFELSHSPRTWHLPQPEVEVVGARAILRGEVPHALGRSDLERTAAAVTGVEAVDNLLTVTGGGGTNGHH